MSWWIQYKALMWKNIILKKRHPVSTLTEIFLPVLLMLLLILLRAEIKKEDKDSYVDIYHPDTYVLNESPESLMNHWQRWLSNQTAYYKLGIAPNNSDFIEYLDSNYNINKSLLYVFDSSSDFKSYIKKSNYGKDSTPYIAGFIDLSDVEGPNFDYTIWMNVTLGSTSSDVVLTAECVPTNYYPKLQVYANWFLATYPFMWAGYKDEGSGKNTSDYLTANPKGGFLALQLAVDTFIMQQTVGSENVNYPTLNIRPFPTPEYVQDIFAVAMEAFLGLLLTLVYIWPVTRIVKGIVEEKEKRIKEGMKIMGLTEPVLITSWLSIYMIIFFIVSVLITLVTSVNVFTHSNKIIIFLLFYLFSMAIYSFAYLVSVFFTRAKVGSIIAALLLMALLAPGFGLTDTSTRSTRISVSLSPITAFYLTAYNVFTFESDSIGATWDNLTYEFDYYTVLDGISMMLFDSVLFFLLAIYLTYVLPATYGVPLPFYFPCMPSFWCPKKRTNGANNAKLLSDANKFASVENQENFEPVSRNLEIGVHISHLRKVFPTTPETVAVKDLSLNMYKGQIFALLGHNGAGKTTTINMLTGMFPPTSGDAWMSGDWISTEMLNVRKKIGFCPQHDILFDDLTVKEHLLFYSSIKGLTDENEIKANIEEMIACVGLEEKTNALSKSLSGGQKRRLSVAIALLGDSEICFLDEPTSGMDVFYRRHTWELLKKMKSNRVIVLTTHFMDEADQIGDRIAIMSHGYVRCCGSSLFLKSIYGVGYTMTIVKQQQQHQHQQGTGKARNEYGAANGVNGIKSLAGSSGDSSLIRSQPIIDLVFRYVQPAGYFANNNINLEEVDNVLIGTNDDIGTTPGNQNVGVTDGLLDTVVNEESLGFNEISASTGAAALGHYDSLEVSANERNSSNGSGNGAATGMNDKNGIGTKKDETTILSDAAGEIAFRVPFSASHKFPQLFAQLDNENICAKFGISHYGVSVTTLEEVFLRVGQDEEIDVKEREINRRRSRAKQSDAGDSTAPKSPFLNQYPNKKNEVTVALRQADSASKPEDGVDWTLYTDMHPNAGQHMYALLMKRFHNIKRDKRVWTCQLLIPFLILMLGIALVKAGLQLGQQDPQDLNANDEFNQPLYTPWFSYDTSFSFDNIYERLDYTRMVHYTNDSWDENVSNDWLQFSKFLLRTRKDYKQSQYGAFYVSSGSSAGGGNASVAEGANNVTIFINTTARDAVPVFVNLLNRQLLRNITNGTVNYTIDTTYHPYPLTTSQAAQYDSVAGIWIALGLGFIPPTFAAYVVMERVINIKHLQVISGINLVSYWLANWIFDFVNFFITSLFTVVVIEIYDVKALVGKSLPATIALLAAFSFAAPPYTYCWSFLFKNANSAQNFILLLFFITGCVLAIVVGVLALYTSSYPMWLNNLWRIMPNFAFLDGIDSLLVRGANLIEGYDQQGIWTWKITGRDLTYLMCEGVGYFILCLIIEFSEQTPWVMQMLDKVFRFRGHDMSKYKNENEELDIDVINEQKRVARGDSQRNGDIIILKNLSKVYPAKGKNPPKLAVNNLAFGVGNGECFGFLGMNGAGKTSTLKILSGDILPSQGSAMMNGFDLINNARDVRKHIGYCPQFDAILPLMTGKELLYFFARIKGVSEDLIETFVMQLIDKIGLNEYYNQPCGGYSGGNKRKLSVGMALIGNPAIVFLDEPSTGIDPASRRFMWNLISNTMQGRSVILTTHSMEEAEALCMRIGIMVNGQLSCLGSAQHLRSRFGKGYQIDVNFDVSQINGDEISNGQMDESGQNVIDKYANVFEEWIQSRFTQWEKLEEQNSHFKYKVDKSLTIGMIFNEIEMNKVKLNIKEYSVSQTSLEQIFMYFARNQIKEDGEQDVPMLSAKPTKRAKSGKRNRNGRNDEYRQLV